MSSPMGGMMGGGPMGGGPMGGPMNMSNINNYDPRRRKAKQPVKKTLARLWRYLGVHKNLIILAIAIQFVAQLCNMICPKLTGKAVGAIGVFGPSRMDYSKVISTVEYLSESLSGERAVGLLGAALDEE